MVLCKHNLILKNLQQCPLAKSILPLPGSDCQIRAFPSNHEYASQNRRASSQASRTGAMEEGAMAKELLPDALWARIAPLLPPEPPKPKGGRPRVSDRAALTGILFVLKVDQTLSWLNRFRRLKIRYERQADIHLAFWQPGCALISLRFLG
jgi:transposase